MLFKHCTDAYSKKIIGYYVADNMGRALLQELNMAIKQRKGVKETPLGYRTEQAQYCTE
jgi:hypothetical protein